MDLFKKIFLFLALFLDSFSLDLVQAGNLHFTHEKLNFAVNESLSYTSNITKEYCLQKQSFLASKEQSISSLECKKIQYTASKRALIKNSKQKFQARSLQRLFKLYWDWYLAEYPDQAIFFGYPVKTGNWTDWSEEAIDKREKQMSQFLEQLSFYESLNIEETDKTSLLILKRILEEEIKNSEFGYHYLPINQMFGIHLTVPLTLELMPRQTAEDFELILARLQKIPLLFEQITHLLEKGLEKGVTPPKIAIQYVPEQILNQIVENPIESPLLKPFQQFPNSIESEIQSHLLLEAQNIYQQTIVPALNKFYHYITEHYLPNCRETIAFTDLPSGQEWYSHLVQSMTTTSLNPQEIHKIGLKEVERIHQEMLKVIEKTGFEGTFEEFLSFLKTDPQFFYSSREELLKGYQALTKQIEAKLPLLFNELPKLPFEVVPVPSYSEKSQIGAYYCPGSIKDNRPGYFYINTSYPEQRAKWEMEPLALHEAVPGHHLQISLAQEMKGLPEFRKNTNFTAYIEGWGLYAESLGKEFGLYKDPYSVFGRLSCEMLRAIRLVVDTGMHAMGWSRELAFDFFKQYVGMSDHEIMTEIDRYLVLPGQALAYKIGELKIQEMRQFAKEELREKFDIRDFHQAWLENGTVPLDIAEKHIQQWIEKKSHSI